MRDENAELRRELALAYEQLRSGSHLIAEVAGAASDSIRRGPPSAAQAAESLSFGEISRAAATPSPAETSGATSPVS
jgi:hypothetical protein